MLINMKHLKRAAIIAPLAVLVTACTEPPPPEPKLLAEPSALKVDKETKTLSLAVDSKGRPSTYDKRRLHAFIADLAGNRPESVHITVTGAGTSAQARSVSDLLVGAGVAPSNIVAVQSGTKAATNFTLTADHYTVEPPDCPGWSTASVATNDNTTRANLGCSNLANLAAMVADPHDLIRGKSSRYGDGTTGAAAVQRYDEDNIKKIPTKTPTYIVGGAPAGGQQ